MLIFQRHIIGARFAVPETTTTAAAEAEVELFQRNRKKKKKREKIASIFSETQNEAQLALSCLESAATPVPGHHLGTSWALTFSLLTLTLFTATTSAIE